MRLWPTVAAGMAWALAACQSAPPIQEDLESARASYERGRNDPLVMRNAGDRLEEARRTLATADEAWADRRDERETRRLSALATQQADAAVASAAQVDERPPVIATLPPAPVIAATPSTVLVPVQALLFEPGTAKLPPAAWRTVERVAGAMQQWPRQRVVLTGHADGAGPRAANRKLSRQRAEAFKRALMARGIAPERILVRAQGARLPVAPNGSATGRAMNRRLDIAFPTVAER